ncbi:hypothetical protein [Parabacteroides johnsonii]|jgi:hypothetical protein|uniref:hypothetical protein n=1 Tax=Parabacteroides johnsonii TaxID=387661 RepID=UPI0011DE3FF6|nr:hypothetical protein [Parabacteroides johnsonii]DAJ56835.1 MAG TPA: hypothetical protein [Caudoviricetes sp.]
MDTQIIETVIQASLNEMFNIGSEFKKNLINEALNTKIIFPCKWKTNEPVGNRVSEQEARFIFINYLEKERGFDGYYSVEAPTRYKYRFYGEKEPYVDIIDNQVNCSSASVDVCLYNKNLERVGLVEFKAHNVNWFSIQKDLLKILIEGKGDCFFVHVLESSNKGTLFSLNKDKYLGIVDKYKKTIAAIYSKYKSNIRANRIIFYIGDIKEKKITRMMISLDDIAKGNYSSLQ